MTRARVAKGRARRRGRGGAEEADREGGAGGVEGWAERGARAGRAQRIMGCGGGMALGA